MGLIYVNEDGAKIGIQENRCYVSYKDGEIVDFPIETVDSITIMSRSQMTTSCIEECLQRGIAVAFFSKGGRYFGRLNSTGHVNTARQRKQAALYNSRFALEFSKKIIEAKINNQLVILRRYEKNSSVKVSEDINAISTYAHKISSCDDIDEVLGYEGMAARDYFSGLSKVIDSKFHFVGRSRRPPLDEFNSMLSLGYSILMSEVICSIENKGLNPFFGLMHRDKEKHPSLASDLMEEWRAIIVDSIVMSMLNGHEMDKDDFYFNLETPGCFITRDGLKKYISKLEKKFQTEVKYIKDLNYPINAREAIAYQTNALAKAIMLDDIDLYCPVRIR